MLAYHFYQLINLKFMKKLKFAGLLLAAMTMIAACSKDNDDDKKEEPASLSVEYNGVTWEATTVTAVYNSANGSTSISASRNSPTDQVAISFSITTGNEAITEPGEGAMFSISTPGLGNYTTLFVNGVVGELTITKYDMEKKLASGTFHCSAKNFDYDVVEFTNGQFTNVPVTIY
ncbi:hypothetical protein SDC9_14810 [bioreactor metagenome]|uniref:Uncharacterized protein n=2 Tax=root TaxID=1 RepID=A0A644TRI5_9ZZZZ